MHVLVCYFKKLKAQISEELGHRRKMFLGLKIIYYPREECQNIVIHGHKTLTILSCKKSEVIVVKVYNFDSSS